MVAEIDIPWIAINVSSVQLRDENFADRCLSIVRQMGFRRSASRSRSPKPCL